MRFGSRAMGSGLPEPGTIGKCLPDPRWAVRVSDRGELQLRTPSLFVGYWENPEASAAAMSDGWYCTGDLVELAPTARSPSSAG